MTGIPDLSHRIGLLADSHGETEATRQAIRILRRKGASTLIHLGDVCDSLRPTGLASLVDLLQAEKVTVLKGNNDFLLASRLGDGPMPGLAEPERIRAFLAGLPMTLEGEGVCFAHSRPGHDIRSFYEPIDTGNTDRAEALFRATAWRILFCGHSHQSVLFRFQRGKVRREPVPRGEVFLDPADRHIVIVGAVSAGSCAVFDRTTGRYETLTIL